jgi:hypothetical protein
MNKEKNVKTEAEQKKNMNYKFQRSKEKSVKSLR